MSWLPIVQQIPSVKQLTQLAIIKDCEVEANNLAAALANEPGGPVSRKLREQIEKVEKRYKALVGEQNDLQTALNTKKLPDDNIATAIRFREDVMLGIQAPTFEDKRRAFELLNIQVTVKDQQAIITCYIPTESGVIDLRIRGRTCRPSNPRRSTRTSRQWFVGFDCISTRFFCPAVGNDLIHLDHCDRILLQLRTCSVFENNSIEQIENKEKK